MNHTRRVRIVFARQASTDDSPIGVRQIVLHGTTQLVRDFASRVEAEKAKVGHCWRVDIEACRCSHQFALDGNVYQFRCVF